MFGLPFCSLLDCPDVITRAAKAILTRLVTAYSSVPLFSWLVILLGNHNNDTVLDGRGVVVIDLNVTNPTNAGVVFSPPLSNSGWQVRPFGSPHIEVATSLPDPSMSFQFQGTAIELLADPGNFDGDVIVTLDSIATHIVASNLSRTTDANGTFTFFAANNIADAGTSDYHNITIRSALTSAQSQLSSGFWNLAAISLTPSQSGGGIVPLPQTPSTQPTSRRNNHRKVAGVIAGSVTGTCIVAATCFLVYRWSRGRTPGCAASLVLWLRYSYPSRSIRLERVPSMNPFDQGPAIERQVRLGEVQPFSVDEANHNADTAARIPQDSKSRVHGFIPDRREVEEQTKRLDRHIRSVQESVAILRSQSASESTPPSNRGNRNFPSNVGEGGESMEDLRNHIASLEAELISLRSEREVMRRALFFGENETLPDYESVNHSGITSSD